jgi:1,4-alpha-glucan branching enzyme
VQAVVTELNRLYRELPALHAIDFEEGGFQWIDCHDASQSVLSYVRWGKDGSFVVVILNFTPVPREGYRLGVPRPGHYQEIFNSDSEYYWGSNIGNEGAVFTEELPWMGFDQSIKVTLPPLGALILQSA